MKPRNPIAGNAHRYNKAIAFTSKKVKGMKNRKKISIDFEDLNNGKDSDYSK